MNIPFEFPYPVNQDYKNPIAYFCMEYAIHQPLKIYAGGLGFLAGSYLKSAYELKQQVIAIGILWKYGYYNQGRKGDQTMEVLFQEKNYKFLEDTGIKLTINVSQKEVWVHVYYLKPEIFKTAPLFLLTTDVPENDHLARTICHKLYDSNPETSAAASILLGEGGAKLLEILKFEPFVYHLNESHALPLVFYLYNKYQSISEVKSRLVFTNHTPEPAGNLKSDMYMLNRMSYFCNLPIEKIKELTGIKNDILDHTLTALRLCGKANAVSKMHLQTLKETWKDYPDLCELTSVTNAQNFNYWSDKEMYESLYSNNDNELIKRKIKCKQLLFEDVADQCGVLFDPEILTIVFAKRFAGYKRAELLFHDMNFFHSLVSNKDRPVQIIWAGKPYPMDYEGIASFDRVVNVCKTYPNCAIMVGYELKLSKLLKQGADIWLNTPRLTHEASGTSGMSAAMNGCINVSIPDGWFPEFARDGINSFIIPNTEISEHKHQQDETDAHNLYNLLDKTVIPMYYNNPEQWLVIIKNGMNDIIPYFDSNRMVMEYREKLYTSAKTYAQVKVKSPAF